MANTRSLRHWGGFIVSGLTAALIDALITSGLVHDFGLDPFSSRIAGILVAMVAAWLLHRRLTFAMRSLPNWREFVRFAAVAWSANLLNYVIYSAILIARPATLPFVAIIIATAIAAVFSYLGFRLGVFREPTPPA
ncbi:MAG TPA: GtrA family protein [Bauldia sp.]|nr:GtrA family protein [Bauldia sp.]